MTETILRVRRIGLGVASAWVLYMVSCVPAQPSEARPLPSFGGLYHTGWGVRDGVPQNINDLAQTADGYLWIATQGGLYRFDGVAFEQYRPSSGPMLVSDVVTALLAQPDGGLWIGYSNGSASLLKDGILKNFGKSDGLGARDMNMLARDFSGAVWAATAAGLMRFDGSHWTQVGAEWNFPASFADVLYVDHQGTLWVSSGATLVYLPRGDRRFHSTGLRFRDFVVMTQAHDGVLWTSGIKGLVIPFLLSPDTSFRRGVAIPLRSTAISIDHEGMLWVATTSNGIWRLPTPAFSSSARSEALTSENRFARTDGLTSNEALQVMEDAEHNVWIATSGGLDRFRRAKLNSVALPSGARGVVLAPAGREGVLVSTGAVPPGMLRISAKGSEPLAGAPPALSCAYRDRAGTLWLGGINALWKSSGNGFIRVPLPPAIPYFRSVQAITVGPTGDVWISFRLGDMFRLAHGRWAKFGDLAALPRSSPLTAYTDSRGRIWFGYENDLVAVLEAGSIHIFSAANGLHVGNVTAFSERAGDVWIGGTSGVQLLDGTRFQSLAVASGELRAISGIVERKNGELWLNQMAGVVRIGSEELAKFKRNTTYQVRADIFDALDGMPGSPLPTSRLPSAVESLDGSLWFSTASGLAWIDPDNIQTNPILPTVLVQSVKADDKTYSGLTRLTLPNRVQNLVINYTALSLAMPERVRFQYMLEGFDKDWQQAGTRRQAFYSHLPPGDYCFRVAACNNDGLWNRRGGTYGFRIAPAYYQTNWFRVLAIVAVFVLLLCLYRLRLRQLGRQLQLRYEDRLAERTRIARALHDTLLQSFHGLILRFQAVQNMLPERPTQAREALESAIDRAARAITEGRDAVQELRGNQMSSVDLVETLTSMGRELAEDNGNTAQGEEPAKFRLLVEGTPRHVHPTVQDTLSGIAREAISNAFRHARGKQIEVDLRYSSRILRLRVRDDGIGMDTRLLLDGRRAGHWGLPGMRERARSIGGHFELWSEIHRGTEVEVTIAGAIAYKAFEDGHAHVTAAARGVQP